MLVVIIGGDKVMIKEDSLNEQLSFFEVVKFLSHFITKIILYVIFFLLIIIFLVFVVYFADAIYNIKTDNSKTPLFNAFIIVSPSMVPNINVQDGIVVKREEIEKLKKGDIITFTSHDYRYNGLTITHRIVGIEKTESGKYLFRTKGDANNVEDSYLVQTNDIYGRVIFRIPMIGYIRQFLSNSFGSIMFVGILAVLVIIYDVLKFFGIVKKNKKLEVRNNNMEEDEVI